jgi:hypothetical protein
MDELEAEQWIHSRAERWRNESGADWAVTDASGLLGRVGLTHLDLAQGPSVKRPCTPTDGMTCTFTRAWPVTPDRTRAASRHVGAGAAIRGRQDHVIASILACALARAGPETSRST